MFAVKTNQLSKEYVSYHGWRRWLETTPVQAVRPINLTVETGELFGLLGPNGAGKTTLVKMLCTLLRPSRGTAVVAGHPLNEEEAIRAAVGLVVSDERSFYWRLSAQRNLEFFAALYGLRGREAERRVQKVLAQVDLTAVAERRFSDFSSGMRQRLAIARALLHQPQILFLDEPSRSLDPTATQQLHDLIFELRQQQSKTIFLITHDLNEAEKLCDRVALMNRGAIRTVGTPEFLRQQLRPQRHYTIYIDGGETAVSPTLTAQLPSVQWTGNQVTFQAGEADGLLTAVLAQLHEHQIPIQNIESSPPSLEEVFTHYTQSEADPT